MSAKNSDSTFHFSRYILISTIAAISAILYIKSKTHTATNKESVLLGLLDDEKKFNLSKHASIAVGFGSCLDLKTNAIPLMAVMGIDPPGRPQYHEKINTKNEFSEMLAFYMVKGAAAERYIPLSLLKELCEATNKFQDAVWTAGGNAPVMAHRFNLEGFEDIYVGSKATNKLKSYFPADLKFLDGEPERDDVHLILEYTVGEKWGNFTVTRANRFIVHSDTNNPYIESLEEFRRIVKDKNPRLVIASALQMLDHFPYENKNIRKNRMVALEDMLKEILPSSLVHFEMASFIETEMMTSILKHVMPYVDSVGMNEQELPNLVSMIQEGKVTTVADSYPRTATVLDGMRQLYNFYSTHSHRQLTRIHVHTLAFQAILVKRSSPWKNTRIAAAKASLVALRHVCDVDTINLTNTKLIMDDSFSVTTSETNETRVYFNKDSPISCWDEFDYEICVSPVLVCTAVKQTAGAGDNISAAGIMVQI